jgi:hypothetical protein
MRAVRHCAVVVSLLVALGTGSAFASIGDDGTFGRVVRKGTHRSFLQRILDYVDSQLSVPPG